MSKVILHYDDIYLVGTNEERTSAHRVTERDSRGRPGVVEFTGNYPEVNGEETYGVLVLNEELWERWFGKREKLVHMATADLAATCLVQEHPNIYYGCPLCTYKSKNREQAKTHIEEHANKFFKQFRVEVVEE